MNFWKYSCKSKKYKYSDKIIAEVVANAKERKKRSPTKTQPIVGGIYAKRNL